MFDRGFVQVAGEDGVRVSIELNANPAPLRRSFCTRGSRDSLGAEDSYTRRVSCLASRADMCGSKGCPRSANSTSTVSHRKSLFLSICHFPNRPFPLVGRGRFALFLGQTLMPRIAPSDLTLLFNSSQAKVECMRLRPTTFGLVAVVALAFSITVGKAADPDFIPVTTDTGTIAAIGRCLRQDKEAVLVPNGVNCKVYREGAPFLAEKAPDSPFDFDADRDCPKTSSGPVNARRLSADVVQRLVSDSKLNVGLSGIRILGAIFCERVKLVGLELPFSLVLDKAVFARGIEIRNLRTKGDLSLDGSLILDQLRIIRSHIEGSLFADGSFVHRLSIGNSTIDTSASFTESVLFESAQVYNASIVRELSVRGSALSYFVTQFSHIGARLLT
jgi:hypothetical protein